MNTNVVLVLGAGRSSSSLIRYLFDLAPNEKWQVWVADLDFRSAQTRVGGSPFGKALSIDTGDDESLRGAIRQVNLVISLLPPPLHPVVARICLGERKHMLTASYVSKEMAGLDAEARKNSVLLLNECGLDPGLDHMSAMEVIHRIKGRGGELTSFESFTGGLIAPATDTDNPWRYKFTWNPRNVVMAGQGTARYIEDGFLKFIPYQQLFTRTTRVHVPGLGDFDGYANRDSLQYREAYGLKNIPTLLRGTLRYKGFCQAWNLLVQLGCTEDTYEIDVSSLTHRGFVNLFLGGKDESMAKQKLMDHFSLSPQCDEIMLLDWSGLFNDEPVGMPSGTPASILEHLLNKKWKLNPGDKDMIVMWHRFRYTVKGRQREIQSSLVDTGRNEEQTAMARTVGLPLAIATKLVLQEKIRQRGVVIPVTEEFYTPILKELSSVGIRFQELERDLS